MPPKSASARRKPDPSGASTSTSHKRTAGETLEKAPRTPRRQQGSSLIRNTPPTKRLDVFVFGTNCYGELSLGDATKKTEMMRPILNMKLAADTVGVVDLAVGGVHSVALTHDNRILTWGVNDDVALGRDTQQDPEDIKMRDQSDSDADSEDAEADLNLKEATPLPVDSCPFPDNTRFAQLAATSSATFTLTTEGLVYDWGTFLTPPVVIPGLDNTVKISAGADHVLALTSDGTVFSWGCDEQHQLGRRRVSRLHSQCHPLIPGECALPSGITDIGTGSYHSFAIHKAGTVYAWGSNNLGQTAIFTNAGQNDAVVVYPTKAQSLKGNTIISIQGGKDHSLAITREGKCLSWGPTDNKALGLDIKDIPSSHVIFDIYDRRRILKVPTVISVIEKAISYLGIGTGQSIAITQDGEAYSWGFNVQNQAGQPGVDEVVHPTLLSSNLVPLAKEGNDRN